MNYLGEKQIMLKSGQNHLFPGGFCLNKVKRSRRNGRKTLDPESVSPEQSGRQIRMNQARKIHIRFQTSQDALFRVDQAFRQLLEERQTQLAKEEAK